MSIIKMTCTPQAIWQYYVELTQENNREKQRRSDY